MSILYNLNQINATSMRECVCMGERERETVCVQPSWNSEYDPNSPGHMHHVNLTNMHNNRV